MDDMIVADPLRLFDAWFEEASTKEPDNPNAMTVATVDDTGMPSSRILLLKGVDARGFVFYTNLRSRKSRQIAGNPKAALCFHWKSTGKQVRVEGAVESVDDAEADAYYASRPRGSQIGAWASHQSEPLESRAALIERVADFEGRFGAAEVPRPVFWGGWRVVPSRIEFWRDGAFRLHDRIVYERDGVGWSNRRLFP